MNVATPLPLVVAVWFTDAGPPVNVTLAPETGDPAQVTVAVSVPVGYPVSVNVEVRSLG